jgi:hypothetical protein
VIEVEFVDIPMLPLGRDRTVMEYDSQGLTLADGRKLGYPPILLGYVPKSLEDAQHVFDMIQGILDENLLREDLRILRLLGSLRDHQE